MKSSFFKDRDTWLALGLAAVYLRGMFLDVMDVDASQYASISLEMLRGGQWLEVMHRHSDYLDKPPLLFWSAAASFGLFGVSNFAYKLPALLSALAGVWAVWRFSKLFYPAEVARQAAFVFASAFGLVLMSNDLRTDALLCGTTACAVWQLAEYLRFGRWRHWFGGFVCVGLAMLAKGPIGLVVPAFAVGAHLMLRREWRSVFRWQWLPGLVVVALMLAPMCWGLYQQFDLHPEKPLRDRNTTSGLYFYFWEQSFGRVTGENVWDNDTSPLYFVHTYLWAFLPWSLVFVGALWARLRALLASGFRILPGEEAFSIGGFVLTFAALSSSHYKLPHYIFVTLPFASVLTARFLAGAAESRVVRFWHGLSLALVAATALAMPGFVFFEKNAVWFLLALLAIFGLAGALFFQKTEKSPENLVRSGTLVAIGFGLALNFWFYPHLLPYQSTAAAGRLLRTNGIPAEQACFFNRHGHALDFYARGITRQLDWAYEVREAAQSRPDGLWLYTNGEGRAVLDSTGVRYRVMADLPHFQVARLNGAFLNPATRHAALEPAFLLKIEGK